MAELQVALTPDERNFLVSLLEYELKEKRVEEHRTRTPIYRESVVKQEDVIASLLRKLGKPSA